MREIVKRNINGREVLLLFILTNMIYAIMVTVTIPNVMRNSSGLKILDMMPGGYTTEYVNTLLNTLGERGRNAYLFFQVPVDMIYPLLFAISSCLVLAYFLNKLNKLEGRLFYLCFIPLFAGAFDYCENIGIITMLTSYPNNSDLFSKVTSVFTVLKSIFSVFYFILLITLLIVLAVRKIPAKRIRVYQRDQKIDKQ